MKDRHTKLSKTLSIAVNQRTIEMVEELAAYYQEPKSATVRRAIETQQRIKQQEGNRK